jgi:hypothetical protein
MVNGESEMSARWNRVVMAGTVGRGWVRGTWRQRLALAANMYGREMVWAVPARVRDVATARVLPVGDGWRG